MSNLSLMVPAALGPARRVNVSAGAERQFKLEVLRTSDNEASTSGELYVNGSRLCYTLELPWRENERSISRIPAGRYDAKLRYDNDSKWRIELVGVEKRSNIQMHLGNYTYQIEGCILVGTGRSSNGREVTNSRDAWRLLLKEFYGSELPNKTPNWRITAEFTDPKPGSTPTGQTQKRYELGTINWNNLETQELQWQAQNVVFLAEKTGKWRLSFSVRWVIPYAQYTIERWAFHAKSSTDQYLCSIDTCVDLRVPQNGQAYDSGWRNNKNIYDSWDKIANVISVWGQSGPNDGILRFGILPSA